MHNCIVDGCSLCEAFSNPKTVFNPENTKLMETEHFWIVPDAAPVITGHILIVSKEHSLRLGDMSKFAIRDYENLAIRISKKPIFAENGFLEAEHGPTLKESAGGCVMHTHIHWFPGCGHLVSEANTRLTRAINILTLTDLNKLHEPYVFLRNNSHEFYCYIAHNIPSKFMRTLICLKANIKPGSQTQEEFMKRIYETITKWNED